LTGRDVCLLSRAQVRQQAGGLAHLLIEGTALAAQLADPLFGMDDEEGRAAEDDRRHRADGQPRRT
jgi:hypothetical protein